MPTLKLQVAQFSGGRSIMVKKNIRHLPILDNGKVVNMLSIRDVIGF